MRDRMHVRIMAWLNRRVVMPRWAIGLDGLYRVALLAGAAVVIILWWQAATRDEEADRNARIQSCSSVYAATYSAWDGRVVALDQRADKIFARLVADSRSGDINQNRLDAYTDARGEAEAAADVVDEMARRRIGLGVYSAASVERGNGFECPPLPARLMVTAVYPEGFTP